MTLHYHIREDGTFTASVLFSCKCSTDKLSCKNLTIPAQPSKPVRERTGPLTQNEIDSVMVASISPTLQVTGLNMLSTGKKSHVSCLSLLADLASMPLNSPTRTHSPSIPMPGPKTPMGNGHNYATSPEKDYFRAPPRTRQASRWKEDWEELELLVRDSLGCDSTVLLT